MDRRAFALAVLAFTAGACKEKGGPGGTPGGQPRIAVIPKGTTHEFWKSVHAGAVKASREEQLELIWKGPLKEDDLREQIELVQSFIAQGVSGIVLAPLNDKALKNPVRAAKSAGIPVVIFDSALEGGLEDSFVATDNHQAGKLAAERMTKLLSGKGKIVVLRYQEGSASTMAREEGFLAGLRPHADLTVVSANQYGGATTESAFATSERLLAAHQAQSGGVDGVFAPNESTTFGMLLALRKANLAGKLKFVGFDASDKLLEGLRQGHVHALVLQDPFGMGYEAVRTMVRVLRKEEVAKRLDTGARLADRENLTDPSIKALIQPDLTRWLEE